MRFRLQSRNRSALTLMEVLCVIVGTLVLVALLLTFIGKQHGSMTGRQCQNNLKLVALAFKVWANDNDDKYPYGTTNCLAYTNETQAWLHYFVVSNELGSARVLTCPQDAARLPNTVMNFTTGSSGLLSKSNSAVSYFVGLDADEALPNALLAGDRNLQTTFTASNARVALLATNMPFLWSAELHTNHGNFARADGAAVGLNDRRQLQAHLSSGGGLLTNRLLLPLVP